MIMAKHFSMPGIKIFGSTRDLIPLSPSEILDIDVTLVHQRANGVMIIEAMKGEEESKRKMRTMMILK